MHGNLNIECLMGQESEAGQVHNIFYHQVEYNLVVVVVVVGVGEEMGEEMEMGMGMGMGMEKHVVFADLAYIVLLSTGCIHQGLPQARLEKIVGFE